mmetsp:Transcript_28262/g.50499  ORF Transcript_28262/g.50499 Transcript_28262/m.50499 type:complete len:108 (-) Transcript_28262:262-585(-)
MSASTGLRTAGRRAAALLRQPGASAQLQTQRSVGKLPVTPNKYVEDWGTSREHLEDGFTFTRGNMARFAAFGIGFPLFCYWGTVRDYDNADAYWGRPKKDLWGSPAP